SAPRGAACACVSLTETLTTVSGSASRQSTANPVGTSNTRLKSASIGTWNGTPRVNSCRDRVKPDGTVIGSPGVRKRSIGIGVMSGPIGSPREVRERAHTQLSHIENLGQDAGTWHMHQRHRYLDHLTPGCRCGERQRLNLHVGAD